MASVVFVLSAVLVRSFVARALFLLLKKLRVLPLNYTELAKSSVAGIEPALRQPEKKKIHQRTRRKKKTPACST